ncbi:MAG TPA: hypothetical protein H9934_03905 [Candidatus Anaerobutyricum faecale]|nr:hypothetical protein [Eubacterium sp. An11]HJC31254.1 hypothetical protein [Candidatus Anaerobutyricum faecale]
MTAILRRKEEPDSSGILGRKSRIPPAYKEKTGEFTVRFRGEISFDF